MSERVQGNTREASELGGWRFSNAYVALFASAPFSAVLGATAIAMKHQRGGLAGAASDGVLMATAFYWLVTWVMTMIVGSILIVPIVALGRVVPVSARVLGLVVIGVGAIVGAFMHTMMLGYDSELTGLYREALVDGAILGGIGALCAVALLGHLQKSRSA